MGRSCRKRSHLSYVRSRILPLQENWWVTLNKSGNDAQPVRKRSDFKQALSTLKRLYQEAPKNSKKVKKEVKKVEASKGL